MKNNVLLLGLFVLLGNSSRTLSTDQLQGTGFEVAFKFKCEANPSSFLPLIGTSSALYALWKAKALITEKAPHNASAKELVAFTLKKAQTKKKLWAGLLVSAASFATYGLSNYAYQSPRF